MFDGWTTGWIWATPISARSDTTPTSLSLSTTGRWRYPCSANSWKASCTDSVGAQQSTGWVIHSLTFVSDAAAPVALKRTRSRSVRMPMGRSPSTMTTEPFFFSAIRFDTSATVSDEWAVIAGELITSATVRMVLVAGMPRILPTVSIP